MSACRPSLSQLALALSLTGDRPRPLPLSGTEPATPHLDVVPRPPSPVAPPGGGPSVQERGTLGRRVAREGRGGAGTRPESLLPRRLRLWMLAVVVERPARAPLVAGEASRRPGCRATAPMVEASGGETPWRARAADSRWRLVLNVPGPLAMARDSPTQQPLLRRRHVFATPAYLAAPRGSLSPSVGPPTRRAAPGAVRIASRRGPAPLPDAEACPPTSFSAGRGGAPCPAAPCSGRSRARVGSPPAVVDRPRARADRPRAGESGSASAGPDATGGCPPTRSRAAGAGCLPRGTPPRSSTPPL